jgi:hypothetical protein
VSTIARITWLPGVLETAGVDYKLYRDFATRGRPASSGSYIPRAIFQHHDASSRGPSPELAKYIAEVGRPPGTPAPLAPVWVDTNGTWHLLASGRCNHAGVGQGWGVVPRNSGNTYGIGVECDFTTGEKMIQEMYQSLVRGHAAILRYLRADVDRALMGHKEYALGRKSDPAWDMGQMRRDVKAQAVRLTVAKKVNPDGGPWGPFPLDDGSVFSLDGGNRPSRFDGSESAYHAACVKAIQREVRYAPSKPQVTGRYDHKTADAVEWWQDHYNLPRTGEFDEKSWLASNRV